MIYSLLLFKINSCNFLYKGRDSKSLLLYLIKTRYVSRRFLSIDLLQVLLVLPCLCHHHYLLHFAASRTRTPRHLDQQLRRALPRVFNIQILHHHRSCLHTSRLDDQLLLPQKRQSLIRIQPPTLPGPNSDGFGHDGSPLHHSQHSLNRHWSEKRKTSRPLRGRVLLLHSFGYLLQHSTVLAGLQQHKECEPDPPHIKKPPHGGDRAHYYSE